MGMIEWYQKGGADSYPPQKKAKLKRLATKWLERLNKEFDGGNRSGTNALYATLKMKYNEENDEYPSRTFVQDFVERQLRHQTRKRTSKQQVRRDPSGHSQTAQSTITNRLPLFLLGEGRSGGRTGRRAD